MHRFRLQMLGGFRLLGTDDAEIPIAGRKAQALLAYLALAPGRPRTREALATLLWGDRMDEQARHSLRQALSALRRALKGTGSDVLVSDGSTLALAPGALETDVQALEQGAAEDAVDALESAAARYAGPLLDGLRADAEGFDAWLAAERDRVHGVACGILERLAKSLEHDGEPGRALEAAQRLVALNPAGEEGHRLMMRFLAAAGRRSDALKQYRVCVDALRRELDAEPAPETVRLMAQLQAGAALELEPTGTGAVAAGEVGAYPPLPEKPSVAVLAFENMSGDPEQAYFSDGIAEDIITALSKLSGLFVVARHASFAYQGRTVDVRQVGRELGIAYVLGGSVRKVGERVRVTAQLVEAETGRQLWAERFDRTVDDLFAVQDEITEEVVTALDVQLVEGELARLRKDSLRNPAAREAYYRGRQQDWSATRESMQAARQWFMEVARQEPESPFGYINAAMVLYWEAFYAFSDDPAAAIREADTLIGKAVALDDRNAEALAIRGVVRLMQRRFEEAEADAARAVALGVNISEVRQYAGLVYFFLGQQERALAEARQSLRLCPLPTARHYTLLGVIHRITGRHEEALAAHREAIRLSPEFLNPHFSMAATYVAMGDLPAAREKARDVRAIDPQFNLTRLGPNIPFKNPNDLEDFLSRLRQAGLPD